MGWDALAIKVGATFFLDAGGNAGACGAGNPCMFIRAGILDCGMQAPCLAAASDVQEDQATATSLQLACQEPGKGSPSAPHGLLVHHAELPLPMPCFLSQGTCQELEKSYFRLTSAPDPAIVRCGCSSSTANQLCVMAPGVGCDTTN